MVEKQQRRRIPLPVSINQRASSGRFKQLVRVVHRPRFNRRGVVEIGYGVTDGSHVTRCFWAGNSIRIAVQQELPDAQGLKVKNTILHEKMDKKVEKLCAERGSESLLMAELQEINSIKCSSDKVVA